MRFMNKLRLTISLLLLSVGVFAQNSDQLESIIENEKSAWLRHNAITEQSMLHSANNRSDIIYTRFHFWVDPAVRYIRGELMTSFIPFEMLTSLDFDFSSALTMDSICWHGQKIGFTRNGDILTVKFPTSLVQRDSLTFYYQGVPTSSGFGSFETNTHGNGTPILWTLSEPYGAKEWMPCKQSLTDKIDSVDIFITHPMGYRAASNGVLQSEVSENGKVTSHWKHRYPIATYLVCMAVTNYVSFSIPAPFGKDTTQIVNYVYPENLQDAQTGVTDNTSHLQLYDQLFGLYPFQKEKYGHAQFGWGGGMEHQTMTFVSGFSYELLAHELAHHWFGDKVTCGSWKDIWLNEGFATYLSGLCYEHLLPQYWQQFKQQRINSITSQPDGSVMVDDTTSVNRIFNGRLSYAKGAMVLHMLRWICGDSAFFTGIRNYLTDPKLAYGYAKTLDLQSHLEAVSGKDLQGFFADWYTGQGFPSYQITWSQGVNNQLFFKVNQTQSHPSVPYFELPLPLHLKGANGQTKVIVLNHVSNGQTFQENTDFTVTSVEFDPDLWLISKDNKVTNITVSTHDLITQGFNLRIEPNPVTTGLLRAVAVAPYSGAVQFSLENAEGKKLFIQTQNLSSGENHLVFNMGGLSTGVYFLRIKNESGEMTTKVINN